MNNNFIVEVKVNDEKFKQIVKIFSDKNPDVEFSIEDLTFKDIVSIRPILKHEKPFFTGGFVTGTN